MSSGGIKKKDIKVELAEDKQTQKPAQSKPVKQLKKGQKKRAGNETEDRTIMCNKTDDDYIDNSISTSKYTCLSFLPINIFEQFSKMANVYFLIIGIMQMFQDISISEGQPVIYLPLAVVVCITGCKDLFEDLKRHRSDNEENVRKVLAYRQNGSKKEWCKTCWKDLKVGEMIKCHRDEYVPCDILVIRTSENKGYGFIETKNLDGETNLKRKQAPKETNTIKNIEDLQDEAPFEFTYEIPNPYLYKFKGALYVKNEKVPLGNDNFILRGCSIRNTNQVIGLVTYTGHDTKIMLNSVRAKPKKSKVEKEMNKFIVCIFLSQLIVCFITAIIAVAWYQSKKDELSYLDIADDESEFKPGAQLFIKWGTWILIFTNFVPISLLVTVEMVKFIQGIFISQDDKCKAIKDDVEISATVQASNLNEELGQVEYIFSDKTGTLTANIMKYKQLSVDGISYGDKENKQKFKGYPNVTNVHFYDELLIDDIEKSKKKLTKAFGEEFHQKSFDKLQTDKLFNCMIHLAICHTVVTDEKKDEQTGKVEVLYNASSPDELALLNFAKYMGFEFTGISDDGDMSVFYDGHTFKFKLLHVLEFDSTRKRMSVIVKMYSPDGTLSDNAWLCTKGADSVIEKLLKSAYSQDLTPQNTLRNQTWENLERYALVGLRTLLLAERKIPAHIFDKWNDEYIKATSLIENREEAMDKLQSEIEVELDIVGATAIEDQLQDEVGDTISQLKAAGIKIWVLTGDKLETAVNIGYSCKLLDDSLFQLEIDGVELDEVEKAVEKAYKNLENPQNSEANESQDNKGNGFMDPINMPIKEENDENEVPTKQNGNKTQDDENNNSKQNDSSNNIKNQKKQKQNTNLEAGAVADNTTTAKNNKNSNGEDEENENKMEYAILLTGDALIHIMKPDNKQAENLQKQIMDIASKCKAVMCCRVSPKQKQEVVTMVRNNLPEITSLAIGDGANDVNMITAAHVGIGIRGVEGQQAARASDFAIGEFKIIRELLLNHGRECYRKNTNLICYNFYKNMLLVLPQWWYAFVNGFSGASNYDPYIYQLYNIFYTSLPIVVYAIFDVEYDRNTLLKQPKYYRIGLKSQLFNKKEFFIWLFNGVWQACVCGWFAYLALELNFVQDGYSNNFASSGMASFHNSVIVGNLKILLFSYCYTFATFFTIFGSIVFFIFTHYLFSNWNLDIQNSFVQQYSQGNFWFMNILLVGCTIFIDMFVGRYRYYLTQMEYDEEIKRDDILEKQRLEQQKKKEEEEKERFANQQLAQQQMQMQSQKAQAQGGIADSKALQNSTFNPLSRSQQRSQSLKKSYTGFVFSQTESNQDKAKANWNN